MSPHNTRDKFRQQLKTDGIDTLLRLNPAGRIYGVTFIDHTNGIVANGSVLGKEFSARVFNELYPARTEEKQIAKSKHDRLSQTANPLAGIVNAVLD